MSLVIHAAHASVEEVSAQRERDSMIELLNRSQTQLLNPSRQVSAVMAGDQSPFSRSSSRLFQVSSLMQSSAVKGQNSTFSTACK